MKAAYFYGPEDVRVEERPIPVPGKGEVVIKNKVALTCGTDVKMYMRGYPLLKPPHGFGHEAAGIIVDIGENVVGFNVGDRVVAHDSAPCNCCYYCKRNQPSLCEHLEFNFGVFAEYYKVPASIVKQNMFLLPPDMDFKTAALTEPFSCAVYGIDEVGIMQGDIVVVNGAGPIGLMFIRLAYFKGAKVIVTDFSEERLNIAKKMGAAVTLNVRNVGNVIEAVKQHTVSTRGVDVAIEAVGLPDVWETTIQMARKGGRVLLFGGTKSGNSIKLDTTRMHYSQLTIKGVFHTTPYHVEIAFNLLKNGVLDTKLMVNTEYPIEKIQEAILSHKEGKVIKNCIVFDE